MRLMLHSGGLRSLVATAMLAEKARLVLLFVHDGRPSDAAHHACFGHQAERFNATKQLERLLPHLLSRGESDGDTPAPIIASPLRHAQLLTAAVEVATTLAVEQIVWPAQVGEQFDELARITETIELVRQLAAAQGIDTPPIETPLLEMTDRQVIEVGHQMDVPWTLARSCPQPGRGPCGRCKACARRRAAFDAAAIDDPPFTSA